MGPPIDGSISRPSDATTLPGNDHRPGPLPRLGTDLEEVWTCGQMPNGDGGAGTPGHHTSVHGEQLELRGCLPLEGHVDPFCGRVRKNERFKGSCLMVQSSDRRTELARQEGRRNVTAIGQEGRRNRGKTEQFGHDNAAGVGQFGTGHRADLRQNGIGNIAASVQVGRNCNAAAEQRGNGNVAAIVQTCR